VAFSVRPAIDLNDDVDGSNSAISAKAVLPSVSLFSMTTTLYVNHTTAWWAILPLRGGLIMPLHGGLIMPLRGGRYCHCAWRAILPLRATCETVPAQRAPGFGCPLGNLPSGRRYGTGVPFGSGTRPVMHAGGIPMPVGHDSAAINRCLWLLPSLCCASPRLPQRERGRG